MIESRFWKADLLNYAKKFKPVKKPPPYSEKGQVNFEKDMVVAFFIIRTLIDNHKFSLKTLNHKLIIYRCPCIKEVNNINYWNIRDLYDLDSEEEVEKGVRFICNQLIHGDALYAYREKDRNWGGVHACSKRERQKFVYRIPVSEVIKLLKIAGNDYLISMSKIYSGEEKDYVVKILA